ncbi:ABC transporter substrate-binding protein [Alkalibacter mobilis]|uniref:ABC transporter substrate-binding protein n=1 Tax=Alkalibacter mobilis TaxID=2787712 RepID=UPI00189F94CE|nr:ABC transporter substrate-binding protein [Alkalibacter mobilis]MBF7096230.1 ABC transporter substrate-binding protein [Alkalibacter mobilis]
MRKKFILIFLLISLLFSGCGAQEDAKENKTVRIAEQFGIAYAPIQIMKHQKLIENNLYGATVVWEQMANTTAIREAMVADKLDVGFMAIPPFLIGWDKGMEWKIATGLSYVPVGLVTKNTIGSLADFGTDDRIALPQPGSVQHILLSMACKDELGDAGILDNNLVTLSHPDGLNALMAGNEVTAHFTATPYLETELESSEYDLLLDGREVFGQDFSFIVGVTTDAFYQGSPELYDAFVLSVQEAVDFINQNPQEAAAILSEYYDMTEEEILKHISSEKADYNTTAVGTRKFSDFMVEAGYLSKGYEDPGDIIWEDVKYEE